MSRGAILACLKSTLSAVWGGGGSGVVVVSTGSEQGGHMRIILIGGHGKVALLAAPLLARAGHEVISVIRNPDHAAQLKELGAEPLVLDIEASDVAALASAFSGADAVVFSAGAGGGNPARTNAVDREAAIRTMDAAHQAGIRRYVMVSYHGAGRVSVVPEEHDFYGYQQAKVAADEYLRGTELDWTIIGPGGLTSEPSPHHVAPAAASVAEDAAVDTSTSRELVAEVIRAVLEDRRSVGHTLDFSDGGLKIEDWIGQVAAGQLPGFAA